MTLPTTTSREASRRRRFDRLLPGLFVLGLIVVFFIGGAYVAEFNVPLYQKTLKPSFQGLRALREQSEADWTVDGWYRARDPRLGTVVCQPELAYNGLTLYTSLAEPSGALLISMSGEVIHRWHLPFRTVWPESPHVPRAMPEERIHWRNVRLFPNGDLLAVYTGIADSPNGYGLVKVDKDSHLIWKYSACVHHDFDLDGEGKIYTLTHAFRRNKVKGAPQLRTPMLEDFVVVLSPDGEELERIPVFEAFAKSKFRDFLESFKSDEKGDHTHTNTVHVVPETFANKHGLCSPGDVMISLRNPGVLAILNLQRREIVWAARGMWERQHDPDPLDNGNLLVFDNLGDYAGGGQSRILEWNPISGSIEWCYRGSHEKPFESLSRGSQQLLPNGNILVTESNRGRLFEITHDQKIVWEFLDPHRSGENKERVAVVCGGLRYRPDELTFLSSEQLALATRKPTAVAEKTADTLKK